MLYMRNFIAGKSCVIDCKISAPFRPKYSINVADLSDRLPDNYIQIQETATKGMDKFIVELTKL